MTEIMGIDELRDVLIKCAGDVEALRGEISDVSFQDLGYDSLALIETTAMLERDYGIAVPDDLVTEQSSPGELLGLINERLTALR